MTDENVTWHHATTSTMRHQENTAINVVLENEYTSLNRQVFIITFWKVICDARREIIRR